MYQHIMVPMDGSELAECVLPHLEAIVKGCHVSQLTLVRVVEPLHLYGGVEYRFGSEERQRLEKDEINIARSYLDKVAERLKKNGIAVEYEILHGKIAEELVRYANEQGVDLIIISTHGRSGVSHWVWGSVAERILRSTCAPVFMVRAPGYKSGTKS